MLIPEMASKMLNSRLVWCKSIKLISVRKFLNLTNDLFEKVNLFHYLIILSFLSHIVYINMHDHLYIHVA